MGNWSHGARRHLSAVPSQPERRNPERVALGCLADYLRDEIIPQLGAASPWAWALRRVLAELDAVLAPRHVS